MSGIDTLVGGRYRLVRHVASGGMGSVWQAWDERLERTVALKQLRLQDGLSRQDADLAVQRARREARLTARLHHANAVQVYDLIEDDGKPCLIMQYVASTSLDQVIRTRGPLPADEVARIGTQVAAALAAAHRAGIVHRDVKPGNVLIAEDGTAKITDFGISHAFDDVTLTSTGMVSGTPAYLAPEVARGADSGFASDVFSLGSTLYMALEGRPPFGTDANPMAVLHRVASGTPDPSSVDGPLERTLRDMMARDQSVRPDMVAVTHALSSLDLRRSAERTTQVVPTNARPAVTAALPAGGLAAPRRAEPPRAGPPRAEPPRPGSGGPRRRTPWLPLVAALIVVGIAALLGVVLLVSDNAGTSGGGHAAGPTRAATSPRSHTSAARSHSPAPKPKPKPKPVPPPKGSPSAPSTAAGTPTDSQLAAAVTDYYALLPDNTNEGWDRLTPNYQQNVSHGRGNYEQFWHGMQSVQTSDTSGRSPDEVISTITYHLKDGRVSTERTQFGLVEQDGILKIDSSQVLSSR